MQDALSSLVTSNVAKLGRYMRYEDKVGDQFMKDQARYVECVEVTSHQNRFSQTATLLAVLHDKVEPRYGMEKPPRAGTAEPALASVLHFSAVFMIFHHFIICPCTFRKSMKTGENKKDIRKNEN